MGTPSPTLGVEITRVLPVVDPQAARQRHDLAPLTCLPVLSVWESEGMRSAHVLAHSTRLKRPNLLVLVESSRGTQQPLASESENGRVVVGLADAALFRREVPGAIGVGSIFRFLRAPRP